MELSKELVEELNLDETQVEKITNHIDTEVVPNLKKEYEGLANKNSEGILTGASKRASEKFGVTVDREQGEKWADYLDRISESALSAKTQKLLDKEKELEEKLKNFNGSDELKEKYEKQLKDNDDLLKKVAELEPLKGLDQKLQEKDQELSGLKLSVAFNSVKPNFPETVNKYEADAKWNEFKNGVLEKYTIEIEDNVPKAVDKENHHKKVKLSDLLESDTNIADLMKGRNQQGSGAKPASLKDVDGVPFKVPEGATTEELSLMVREHLEKKLGSKLHPNFASEFQDLLMKIKKTA